MSSEQIEISAEATPTPETAAAVPEQSTKDNKPRRQRTPPEELFDLTQPIPRFDKPNKDDHDEEVEAINTAINTLKESKNEIQTQIELALNGGRNTESGKERDALRALRSKKGALITEKKSHACSSRSCEKGCR